MERNIDIMKLTPEKLAEMQQAERERIAAEEAAKAKAQEEERKKREAAIAERRKKFVEPANAIVAALKAIAPDRTFEVRIGDYGGASVSEVRNDGQYSRLPSIELRLELAGNSWRRYETDKLRVNVGEYGNKTGFPQRKDGTHNYAKIAELAVEQMLAREQRDKTHADAEQARRYNEQGVEDFRKSLRVRKWDSTFRIEPSSTVEKPVFVSVKIAQTMAFSDAEKLYKALLALGLVQQEGE
jgi:translation initiation factor IF-2